MIAFTHRFEELRDNKILKYVQRELAYNISHHRAALIQIDKEEHELLESIYEFIRGRSILFDNLRRAPPATLDELDSSQ